MIRNELALPPRWPTRQLLPVKFSRTQARSLLQLAAPVAGIALVNMAMSVTDTVMSALLGAEALAAAAVGSDFYSIVFYLAIGCIGGLAPLYAEAHAANDNHRMMRLRSAAWALSCGLAIPFVAVLWCAPQALLHLGIDPSLVERGAGYCRAMAVTFVLMLAATVLRSRITALERPQVMLRITLAAVPLNAVCNYALMYGAMGMPALGVTGAGVSSAIVALFVLTGMAIAAQRHDGHCLGPLDWTEVRTMLRIGFPIGVAFLSQVGIYLGATIYAATLSITDAAAHGLAIRVAGVTFAFHVGLQQASMIRLARAGDDPEQRREVVATALSMACATGLALCCVLLVLGPAVAMRVLGTSDAEAARTAVIALGLLAVSDLVGPFGAASSGLLRALRDTRPAMVCSLVGNWALAAPLGLALASGFGLGAVGIWIALAAGTVLESILTPLALRRHRVSGFIVVDRREPATGDGRRAG